MNKKFLSAILFGALMITSTGTFVSCKDYDDDIDELWEQIDAQKSDLTSQVAALQSALDAAKSEIATAKSEAAAAAAKADKAAEEAALAKQAANEAKAAAIEEAIKQAKELIAEVEAKAVSKEEYEAKIKEIEGKVTSLETQLAAVEKYKELIDGKADQATVDALEKAIADLKAAISQTATSEAMEQMAAKIAEIQENLVTMNAFGDLRSLAFIPEVIEEHGLGVIEFYSLKLEDADGETVYVSNTPTATYRVNPQNTDQSEYEWAFINRTVKTRATGDNNDLITITKSEAKVGSRVFWLQADKEVLNEVEEGELPIVALKAVKGDDEIVSDYATVTSKELTVFALAQLDAEGEMVKYYAETLPADTVEHDTTLVYNAELDLNPIVEAWETDIVEAALAELNVENIVYTITKVEEYLGADNVTDQQKFVVLNDGVVTVDKAWLAQGTASIGRTPVFKAVASVNGIEIATGYIKVKIVDKAYVAPENQKDLVIKVNLGDIEYTTIDNTTFNFDWARANAEVYDVLGLTKEAFVQKYSYNANTTLPTGVTESANTDPSKASTETAMASITITNTVKFGNDTVAVTFEANENTEYPHVVIKFGYNIVHTKTLPALNPDYLIGTNIIKVKGRMEGNAWKLISDMDEHFEDYLAEYELPKNHTKFYFRFKDTEPTQTGAEITGNDYEDQVIKLTTPFTAEEASRDYAVQAVAELANGEECVLDYVVRFVRPFNAKIDDMKLKTYTANADSADLAKLVVITDLDNKVVYEEGEYTEYGKDTYKLDQAGIEFDYDFKADDSFGDKLTKVNVSWIKWYNGGADLQKDKTAASVVTITIPEIATIEEEGVITVLSTANSKE